MKEFTSAIEDIEEDEAREARILKRMEEGATREEAEKAEDPVPVEFSIDGRKLHAYPPLDGQLAFMMASLGRGQTNDGRFAAIVNVMLETLRGDDKDWLESRLLSGDPKKAIPLKVIEGVFEYLTEEWFRDE